MKAVLKTLTAANVKLALIQKEMAAKEFTGTAGGGLVQVVLTGTHEPKSVKLTEEVLKEDPATVADLIQAAMSHAYHQINTETKAKTAAIGKSLSPLGLQMPA